MLPHIVGLIEPIDRAKKFMLIWRLVECIWMLHFMLWMTPNLSEKE